MTHYYLSWHPSSGCICTRCFISESERQQFYNRVKDIPRANVKQWQWTFAEEE